MAAKKTTQKERMVSIKIPRAMNGEGDSISASVNGKVFQIKRGVYVKVPESLAEVLVNSERAQEIAIKYIEDKLYKAE